jgi:DNA polymerase III delta prime subunit
MHTFYITGGTEADRLEYIRQACDKLNIASYDIHRLIPKEQLTTIGIADIRPWQKELFLTPLSSPHTIGIIEHAEHLTMEAQNALLKTFEEPPAHTKIYIESQSNETLLPTILSRCQIVQLTTLPIFSGDEQEPMLKIILQLTDDQLPIGKRIALLEEQISNKENAKIWVTQATHTLHKYRKTISTATYIHLMKRLLTASMYLSANVSYKLAIDHIPIPKIH